MPLIPSERLRFQPLFSTLFILQGCFLVLLPLAYGATPFAIKTAASWTALIMGLAGWILLILRNPKASLPPIQALPLLLILAYGWFMVWNAAGIWDSGFWEMLPLRQAFPGLPGSIDRPVSGETMLTLTALAVAFLLVRRFAIHPERCHRVFIFIGLGGFLVVLLGFAQLSTGAKDIWWGDRVLGYEFFFGPYRYHGNAGAFINLAWPVTAACFLISWKNRQIDSRHHLWCQLWGIILLLVTLGALAHGSRAASAIFLFILPIWAASHFGWFRRHFRLNSPAQWFGFIAAGVALLAGVLAFVLRAGVRWLELFRYHLSLVDRWLAYEVGFKAAKDAGPWGFGPGTFKWAFPNYIPEDTERLTGFWRFQHQDYLQTWIEWGWAGSALWILFAGFILVSLIRGMWKNPLIWRGRRGLMLRATLFSSATVLLHSLVDFPQQIFSIQLYFWVLLAVALCLVKTADTKAGGSGALPDTNESKK